MRITVEMMAMIKRPGDLPRKFTHESETPITIRELLTGLGFETDELQFLQYFVDGKTSDKQQKVGKNHVLSDEDNLFITIPVGGG